MLIQIIFSIVFLAVAYAISRSRCRVMEVIAAFCGCAILSVCLNSTLLLAQSVLTFVITLICLVVRAKPRKVFVASVVAALASYAFVIWIGYREIRYLAQLRKQYPFESVSARLDYEIKNQQVKSSVIVKLSSDVEQRLSEFETRGKSSRGFMLMLLHERKRNEFVMASGFGNGRMITVRKERIELPKAEPIPLPESPYQPEYDSSSEQSIRFANEDIHPNTKPVSEQLLSLHKSSHGDFLDPESMGYFKDRDHVAGFQSHAFRKIPELDSIATEEEWQVGRLELVSLLKHDVPMVYISTHLPNMQKLKDVPTRHLDSFEVKALDQLRRNEDLVVEADINRIRMLGSLRAGEHCLECHSVRRGELLGGFSYELFRLRPKPAPKPRDPLRPSA